MASQPVVDKDTEVSQADVLKGASERRRRRFQFIRSVIETRLVLPSLIFMGFVIFAAVFANLIAPHDPNWQDYTVVTEPPLADPSVWH